MQRYTQSTRYTHFSRSVARVSCLVLILIVLSACSAFFFPANTTATKSPALTPANESAATATSIPTITPVSSPAGWYTAISENWAGYTIPRGKVTGVKAAWTEPDISNVPDAHVAIWVGIGGWANSYNNIVQIGTLARVTSDGQIVHNVWYETLPPNSWTFIGSISAGDRVFASIELAKGSAQRWDLALVDETSKQAFKLNVSFPSQRIYSDFVVEDPDATSNNGPPFFPFPRFSAITFHNANVRYAQDWIAIGAVQSLQVTLTQSGVVRAKPGALVHDTFTVTRVGS